MPEGLQIFTLGGLRLRLDGERLEGLSARKAKALLVYLAAQRRSLPREVLAEMFWSDRSQSRSLSNLRVALTDLRKHLEPYVIIDRETVAIDSQSDVWLDAATMEAELEAAGELEGPGDGLRPEAVDQIEKAVSRYQGEFLHGFYLREARDFDEWVTVERERLQKMVLDSLGKLVDWHLAQGAYPEGIDHARRWLQLDPFQERAQQQLMRLLAYSGQQAAALSEYETFANLLDEEMGVEPMAETTALYQAIKEQQLPPSPADRAPVQHRWQAEQPAFLEENGGQPPLQQELFIGRESELAILEKHLQQALAGQGRMLFVTGEAGQGKTMLLREFGRRAQVAHPQLVVANGACPVYTPVGAPYDIFREVMEMLTGDVESAWAAGTVSREQALRLWHLLPEIVDILLHHGRNLIGTLVAAEEMMGRARSASISQDLLDRLNTLITGYHDGGSLLSEQGELFAEFAAVLNALSIRHPLLLLLDDLHWADASSIGLLGHLAHRLSEGVILLVGSYRPEEVNQGREAAAHPLAPVLSACKRRFGEVLLTLDDPEAGSGRTFVDALLDAEPNDLGEPFRQALTHHTGGNPLFTVELLREMQELGTLQRDEMNRWVVQPDFTWSLMPPRVEGVIETRINRLDPELRDWLRVASAEGEIFTAEVLAQIQDTDEGNTVKRLSGELDKQHRLVRAQHLERAGAKRLSRYRFRHNLFREYLYDRLDDLERSYLHEQIGEALEKLFADRTGEIADQLANHFLRAGNDHKALLYLVQAAEDASCLHANDQTVIYYTKAIELAERLAQDKTARADLHLQRAVAFETLGEFDRSRTDNEKALQLGRKAGEMRLEWHALLGLGKAYASSDYAKAGDYFEQALELAQQVEDPVLVARSLNRRGNWYANTNSLQDAIELHEEAFEIYRELQDKQGMADTMDLSSWAAYYSGDYRASAEYFDRAIVLFRELDDLRGLASALSNRGSMGAYYEYHPVISISSLEESIPFLEEAFQTAQQIGWRSQESYALWSLGTRTFALGQFGQGVQTMKESLDIASEIDHTYWIAGELFDLGIMYCTLNAPHIAQQHLTEALTLAGEIESQHFINLINGTLAKTYYLQGDLQKGWSCLEDVVGSGSSMNTISERYCWARWAELSLLEGEPAVTLEVLEQLVASVPGLSSGAVISSLWRLCGDALVAVSRLDEAESVLLAALENAMAFDEHFHLWRIHASLGRLYGKLNRHVEALDHLSTARKSAENLADSIGDKALKEHFHKGVFDLLNSRT
jgi:DNA-binding SARP family transcriptional activator